MTDQQQEEKRYDPNDKTLKFVTRQDDISMYIALHLCKLTLDEDDSLFGRVPFYFTYRQRERNQKQVRFV